MEHLIKNIDNYLAYLSKSTYLLVSVHFTTGVFETLDEELVKMLMPYSFHKNRFCAAVKRCPEYYDRCILNQKRIIEKLSEVSPYESICFAGAKEVVYPIRRAGEPIGFVTASGYRGKKNECILPKLWENALDSYDIPREQTDALLPPLCYMLELLLESSHSGKPSEIGRMLKYISDNLDTVTLDSLSRELGKSPSYVSHTFKSKTGKSLRAYCNELKLAKAKQLLLSTDLSVTEVALESGFEDSAYFIRLFRESFGITPLKYRMLRGSR